MRRVWLILCVAALLLTAGAVLGCGDGNGSGSPSDVVGAYVQATKDLDIDTAYDLMSSDSRELLDREDLREMVEGTEGLEIDFVIVEETIDGNEASVEVTLRLTDKETGESEEFTDTLFLVKEGGEWKIRFLAYAAD